MNKSISELIDKINLPNKNIIFFWNEIIFYDHLMRNVKNLNIYENFNDYIENLFKKLIESDIISSPNTYSIYIKEHDISIFTYIDHINYDNIEIYIYDIRKGVDNFCAKKTALFNDEKFQIIFEEKKDTVEIIFERMCRGIIKSNTGYEFWDTTLDLYEKIPEYEILEKKLFNFLKLLNENDTIFSNKDVASEIYDMV